MTKVDKFSIKNPVTHFGVTGSLLNQSILHVFTREVSGFAQLFLDSDQLVVLRHPV